MTPPLELLPVAVCSAPSPPRPQYFHPLAPPPTHPPTYPPHPPHPPTRTPSPPRPQYFHSIFNTLNAFTLPIDFLFERIFDFPIFGPDDYKSAIESVKVHHTLTLTQP